VIPAGSRAQRLSTRHPKLTAKLKAQDLIAAEEQPEEALQTDEQLMDFVRSVAWDNHASCS
jgi:hypothetical protein